MNQVIEIKPKNGFLTKIKGNLYADIAIVLLALCSVGLLIFELSTTLLPEHVKLIHELDIIIALIFLGDFAVGFYLADSKKIYFKKNWPDLLASIPITEGLFRSLRAVRLLRLIRVVRVVARIRKIGIVADKVVDKSSKYVYTVAITAVVILSGSVAFFSMEYGVNPQVNDFFDAVWYTVVTATTVGYGDIYPSTWEGRIIGMILMFFGIGLVGTIAGLAGAYFLERKHQRENVS